MALLLMFLPRVQCFKKSCPAIITQPEGLCRSVYIQVQAQMIIYIRVLKILTGHGGVKRLRKHFIGLERQNVSSARKLGNPVTCNDIGY